MKKYRIKLNGKVYELEMEEITGEASATVESTPSAPAVNTQPAANGGETISAPMPGVILNVLVNLGEEVKKGQALAILEAMKMENEIVAPVDGRVTLVNVSKGQSVNLGDILVQIS